MAAFTKLVIMRVFENLLSVKPLEKITVKDITDQCGISRNTFYYHYQDIYQVFKAYIDYSLGRNIQISSAGKWKRPGSYLWKGSRIPGKPQDHIWKYSPFRKKWGSTQDIRWRFQPFFPLCDWPSGRRYWFRAGRQRDDLCYVPACSWRNYAWMVKQGKCR